MPRHPGQELLARVTENMPLPFSPLSASQPVSLGRVENLGPRQRVTRLEFAYIACGSMHQKQRRDPIPSILYTSTCMWPLYVHLLLEKISWPRIISFLAPKMLHNLRSV